MQSINAWVLILIQLAVSYDIAKDGEQVAVLTFVKSAYRLGESILGVIDINFPAGRTKVLKVRLISTPLLSCY